MENQATRLATLENYIQQLNGLLDCLRSERALLIAFQTEELIQNNADKQRFVAEIESLRAAVKPALEDSFGASLSAELHSAWLSLKEQATQIWKESRRLAEENIELIQHSIKNVEALASNLRRLLGEQTVYSPKGTTVETQQPGAVLQGRY